MPTRNYFHDNLDKLGVRMQELNAPVDITYVRGSTSKGILNVTIGKTMIEEVFPNTDILIDETRDYIFDYADMRSDFGEPKSGDKIIEAVTGIVAEVMALSQDHCFRWTSATRKRIRVHTKILEG